jgi:hypothetical protein
MASSDNEVSHIQNYDIPSYCPINVGQNKENVWQEKEPFSCISTTARAPTDQTTTKSDHFRNLLPFIRKNR